MARDGRPQPAPLPLDPRDRGLGLHAARDPQQLVARVVEPVDEQQLADAGERRLRQVGGAAAGRERRSAAPAAGRGQRLARPAGRGRCACSDGPSPRTAPTRGRAAAGPRARGRPSTGTGAPSRWRGAGARPSPQVHGALQPPAAVLPPAEVPRRALDVAAVGELPQQPREIRQRPRRGGCPSGSGSPGQQRVLGPRRAWEARRDRPRRRPAPRVRARVDLRQVERRLRGHAVTCAAPPAATARPRVRAPGRPGRGPAARGPRSAGGPARPGAEARAQQRRPRRGSGPRRRAPTPSARRARARPGRSRRRELRCQRPQRRGAPPWPRACRGTSRSSRSYAAPAIFRVAAAPRAAWPRRSSVRGSYPGQEVRRRS